VSGSTAESNEQLDVALDVAAVLAGFGVEIVEESLAIEIMERSRPQDHLTSTKEAD